SVGSADKKTGIPHVESKRAVEEHIARIGARAAILRPVYFMENAIAFGAEQLRQGVYATPLTPGRRLAQIAVADIAAVAVLALENPARFEGKARDLAGDQVSGQDAVEILSRVTGRKFTYFQVPMQVVRESMGEDFARMYEYFEKTGYDVSLSALQREFSEIRWHSYEAWARSVDWKAILAG
ncbi:MAG TPA: NmrA family NAD(P)-binding protein, partial [Myxococcales bacterium]